MEEIAKIRYKEWCEEKSLTDAEHQELESIKDNEKEINERFAVDLEFGTAGLRGVMAVGTNRMNIYIIRKATQGFANWIISKHYDSPSVAIAYDSRNNSQLFAIEAAKVLAENGIVAHLFKELMPTPTLSYAVRYLHAKAGINITASHNPKQYNGYKVYGSDGCQMTIDDANAVLAEIEKLDTFKDVKVGNFDDLLLAGKIKYINEELVDSFIDSTLKQTIVKESEQKRIVNISYTPLHGAGLKCVTRVLDLDGFKKVDVVEEQKYPDGNFPTASYPNPEMAPALELGIKNLKENHNDILIATDPDSDRVGVVVSHKGKEVILTGNEVGILLFDFIYNARKEKNTLPKHPMMVKTIVSSDIINIMARKWGVKVAEVLTGFKFIGEQILLLENKGCREDFLFGFEESCGYLSNPEVRDKDAVNASLLVAECANYYKHKGMTLCDRLDQIYAEFGDFKTTTLNYEFQGLEGKQKMNDLMQAFRGEEIKKVFGNVDHVGDYLKREIYYKDHIENTGLPASNVIKFFLSTEETITIRPSGTEPKIKAYVFAKGAERIAEFKEIIDKLFK